MDKTLSLEAQIRERTGSKAAARVRKQGQIPAVVYGHKQDPVAISLDAHDFAEGLHHGHRVIDVKVGGKTQKMIVKDLQYDHLGRNIVHADLMRVDVTETVRVSVPIELKGTAQGTHESGIVEEHADHVEIECMVTNIPESIVVSIKELGVGQVIHAGDVVLPDGITLASSPDTLLVACHLVAAAKTTEEIEEEAPAAPEVIGEKKEESEEQSGD
ncbi:50S ribosomal protein L25 [Anaerobaca lacustris]|uniref:Large ribosomal subunit protein bL25 n=1 Tax=Anaerobaca lacustris TaxID=3044600 RepID=A0AAW6U1R7_9BACT|nr:50S ribosomal protein L25 [Sedimentisphaerales bacterium M17dextr]